MIPSIISPLRSINLLRPIRNSIQVSVRSLISTKTYATTTSDNSVPDLLSNQRKTAKPLLSRKTFLLDYYKHLNDTNEIILYAHHNNITKNENKKIRNDLSKIGCKLNVIRNRIYGVYLRSENEIDPADKETSFKNKKVVHPLSPLLNGPTAIITIPTSNPQTVAEVLKILKSVQEKLFVVGAKVEKSVYDIDQVNQYKDSPTKEQLQSQLTGLLTILGGAGLVQTLESNTTSLYLTLKQHEKQLSGDDE